MFRSIAKQKKNNTQNKQIVKFDDEKYVAELKEFVKTAFAELPETEIYEEEKKD